MFRHAGVRRGRHPKNNCATGQGGRSYADTPLGQIVAEENNKGRAMQNKTPTALEASG